MTIRVAQIGNFEPEYSTENELLRAMRSLGIEVETFQENDPETFGGKQVAGHERLEIVPELIIWTHTQYPDMDNDGQLAMLARAKSWNIPVIGIHLDRWWGLSREHLLDTEPFFGVDTLYTADGGEHDWAKRGINHKWLPPAVDAEQCKRGEYREDLASEIAFVGSWQGGYHPEHAHRHELVNWLKETYGDRVTFWPKLGEHAVRGPDLRDLYASTAVVIGDSCFTGTTNYWSDRIPETLGRGGYLIHPWVSGLTDHFEPGYDLDTWMPGDWNDLKTKIEYALDRPGYREQVSSQGQETVLQGHTYAHRIREVFKDQGFVINSEEHFATT